MGFPVSFCEAISLAVLRPYCGDGACGARGNAGSNSSCNLAAGAQCLWGKVDELTPIIDLYARYDWGDLWAEGNLVEVARYLRGSKRLHLPPEWRAVIPAVLVDNPMEG